MGPGGGKNWEKSERNPGKRRRKEESGNGENSRDIGRRKERDGKWEKKMGKTGEKGKEKRRARKS